MTLRHCHRCPTKGAQIQEASTAELAENPNLSLQSPVPPTSSSTTPGPSGSVPSSNTPGASSIPPLGLPPHPHLEGS